jgi:hypothetical protein
MKKYLKYIIAVLITLVVIIVVIHLVKFGGNITEMLKNHLGM